MIWEHDHHCDHPEDVAIQCGGDSIDDYINSFDYDEEDDQSVNRYKVYRTSLYADIFGKSSPFLIRYCCYIKFFDTLLVIHQAHCTELKIVANEQKTKTVYIFLE